MNRLLTALLLAGACCLPWLARGADADLTARLAALEALVKQQQTELAELRGTLNTQVSRLDGSIASALDQVAYAQVKDAPLLKLGKNTQNLELLGSVRVRYQREEREDGAGTDDSLDRWRQSVKLGFKWLTTDGLEIGAGLATGDAASPASAVSTNDTYSDQAFFDTGDIRLDYAYGKKTWESEGDKSSLTLGQMINPFVSSWLFWDSDVRPVGLVGQYQMANGLFATLGAFEVNNLGRDEASVTMIGSQLGYNGQAGEGRYTGALAYYHMNSASSDLLPAGMDPDFNFEVMDLYADYQQPVGPVGLKAYGDYFVNLGAESSVEKDNDTGYLLGLDAKYTEFTLGYAFGHVEAVSMLAGRITDASGVATLVPFGDGDLGGTVGGRDYQAHRVKLAYALTKSLTISLAMVVAEALEFSEREGTLYQLDTLFTF